MTGKGTAERSGTELSLSTTRATFEPDSPENSRGNQ